MPSVIVVGAGVFGASAAHRLSAEGWEVTLVEREAPAHDGASSGGESRLLRSAHGSDASYSRSARRAQELWRAIEVDAGEELLAETGIAWLAHRQGGWEDDSERTLRAQGVPVERLEPSEAAALWPSFDPRGLAFVLLEPEAGVLRAAPAVRALVTLAGEHGARFLPGAARPLAGAVAVDGKVLEADAVVWACGPWLPALFPDLISLRVSCQTVHFLEGGSDWRGVPGWVDYDGSLYGHGDVFGDGVKVCSDVEGPALGPEVTLAAPSPAGERELREALAPRFPALARAPLASARACPYELTPDTHFILAPHPEHPGTWLLGGGSGHGFKHGPALAERLVGLLTGADAPDPRFGLGARAPDRSLRTAGPTSYE